MRRAIKIGAMVALASVVGAQLAGAQSMTWGIFRENAADVSESQRNCWVQAMVSGGTINGEVMEQNLTQKRAEAELQKLAQRGDCAAERSDPSWSARARGRSGSDRDGRPFDGPDDHRSGSDHERFGDNFGSPRDR